MTPGKQAQDKIELPVGWWPRLVSYCKDKWKHGTQGSAGGFDVYAFMGVSRSSITAARRLNKMTAAMVADLAPAIGFASPEDLLHMLQGRPASEESKEKSEFRPRRPRALSKARRAQELSRAGKGAEAREVLTKALVRAREDNDDEGELELLIALTLMTSRRDEADREQYFREAERKAASISSAVTRAMFLRARAAYLEGQHDRVGAEAAYREALRVCEEPDDAKGNLATQACVLGASFVHLLCGESRIEEARPILLAAEKHARMHSDDEEGELFQAALEAGIHFAITAADEDGAVQRIGELETHARSRRLAYRIGGELVNVANNASHAKAHRTALAAAEAAIRLGRRADDYGPRSFLVGALYTEAMVVMQAGDHSSALGKAEALLDACNRTEDAVIRQATLHLIAEIRRVAGDSRAAVDSATEALASARGKPEDIAFTKLALARALNDDGQTESALRHAREAWVVLSKAGIPVTTTIDVLGHISNYASQLGEEGELSDALTQLDQLRTEDVTTEDDRQRVRARARANTDLRERLLEVFDAPSARRAEDAPRSGDSFASANAATVRPLIEWWEDVGTGLHAAYDFWGRGSFSRVLQDAQRFRESFNVTVEVRTLDDVQRAVRLWALCADVLILLWKGPTDNGLVIAPFPEDYDATGGWGYAIAAGSEIEIKGSEKKFYPAMSHASLLPDGVVSFLATEARPLFAAGRLVVVPAVGVGCTNPGHGPFEQLLSEAANAFPTVRWKDLETTPIGLLPYSPDAPLALLAELSAQELGRLRSLRQLLLRRAREGHPTVDVQRDAKLLSLEISDALRDLEDRQTRSMHKAGYASAGEPLADAVAPFRSNGRAMAGELSESAFAPLFVLKTLGYGWRVEGHQVPRFPARFEPQPGDLIGSWLAPASSGWAIPTIRRQEE